eukprot:7253920-Ditylum_brightwellii.AAC.1
MIDGNITAFSCILNLEERLVHVTENLQLLASIAVILDRKEQDKYEKAQKKREEEEENRQKWVAKEITNKKQDEEGSIEEQHLLEVLVEKRVGYLDSKSFLVDQMKKIIYYIYKDACGMNKKVLKPVLKIILVQHFTGVIMANDKTKNENYEEEAEEGEYNVVAMMNL